MDVEIKETKHKGKGVFALRDFKKDEVILYVKGKIVKTENPASLSKTFKDHCFPFDVDGDKKMYILPEPPAYYLNHSCDPNAGIKNNRYIVAIKLIKKGEEIVFDYAMNNIDDWTMECSCSSKNCKKIISTFDALDSKTKKRYYNYILDCLKKKHFA